MKTWATPVVEELSVKETAHNWFGIYRDGGYIGDGVISGHLSWTKPGNGGSNSGNGSGNGGNGGNDPTNQLS